MRVSRRLWEGQPAWVQLALDSKLLVTVLERAQCRRRRLSRSEASVLLCLPELHRLQLTPSTVENCRTAISYLIDGPYLPALAPILSNKTRIRAMYLMENGELIVDFSRDLEAGHIKSASAEMLMVDGVVKTLVQLALKGQNDLSVKSVRFLFEGSAYQQSFPTHIDLTDPVRPRQSVPASAGNATNDA
ncbi:MAG TPA: hypothetical protein EYG58_06095 [Nitrospirales bacterium]|nr:hypothetical protein [Nitrospirales bacterium]